MLCRLELTSHDSFSYRQWITVRNLEEGHLKAGHTAAKVVLGKVCAALMSSLLDVWMRRADVQCTQHIILHLYVSLEEEQSPWQRQAMSTSQKARLSVLSLPFSPSFILSQAILPLLSTAVRRGRATGWHDSGNQFTAGFISFCQRKWTFQGLRDHFFSLGTFFLFSPSNICVSESSFGCFSGRILVGDAALHWSVFSLWTIMAGCAHWGILAILCFYGDALAWTYVFPFLSLFTWVDLSLSREAMTSEELICQWGLFIPGEDKENSWMSGQRIQAAMKVRKRALIVARSSLVVQPAARSLTSSWSCRALTSCAISVSQLGTD